MRHHLAHVDILFLRAVAPKPVAEASNGRQHEACSVMCCNDATMTEEFLNSANCWARTYEINAQWQLVAQSS